MSIPTRPGRDVWAKRIEVARRMMRAAGDLVEVTEACAMELAFVTHLRLFGYDREGTGSSLGRR